MFENGLPNIIKRLIIVIWFPFFMISVILGLILSPITWALTGKTVFDFIDKLDPMVLAQDWINHDA